MKRLLLVLILTFNFQSFTNADDIRDFQIEGMSIGDSLLNFFTEDEIKDRLYDTIKFYKQQGIDKEFVKRFYRTPPDELWYPRIQELLKQGLVTEILDE